MKIVVSGSRDWTDIKRIRKAFDKISSDDEITLIHGGCRGLDTLAGQVGKEKGWTVVAFLAKWSRHGRAAGPIRNRQMLDTEPDLVLWFHDDLENSKGTKDLINEATKRGLNVSCGASYLE